MRLRGLRTLTLLPKAEAKGGAKGESKGKDEGKGKGKGKPKAEAKAKANAVRVSAVKAKEHKFPRNAIGIDNWANVHLIHDRPANLKDEEEREEVGLGYGSFKGSRTEGRKSVPQVRVPMNDGENIDLFPHGLLWRRGCNIIYGDKVIIVTPSGKEYEMKM